MCFEHPQAHMLSKRQDLCVVFSLVCFLKDDATEDKLFHLLFHTYRGSKPDFFI